MYEMYICLKDTLTLTHKICRKIPFSIFLFYLTIFKTFRIKTSKLEILILIIFFYNIVILKCRETNIIIDFLFYLKFKIIE